MLNSKLTTSGLVLDWPTVSINLVDHVLQLSLGGILTQWPHDCSQLLGSDGAVSILVKQWERLLELYTHKQNVSSLI